MPILLFEDEQVTQLYPITIGRPAFTISCGSFRLIDRLTALDPQVDVRVRPHLRAVHAADFPAPAVRSKSEPTLLVNARLVPSADVLRQLKSLRDAGRAVRVDCGKSLARRMRAGRDRATGG